MPFRQLLSFLQGDKVKCTYLPWSSCSHLPLPLASSQRDSGMGGWGGLSGLEGCFPQQSYRISSIWNAVK